MCFVNHDCSQIEFTIIIQSVCDYLHAHRFRAANPLGPFHPRDLAQKLFWRAASFFVFGFGAGACKCDPVSLLYFALPLDVSPAPFETGSFSPLLTDNETRLTFMLAGVLPFF